MYETVMTVVGNIATDVYERRTGAGAAIASFGVVSTERRYDKESGDWVDGHKLFVWVSCWRKLATGVLGSLKKGDPVVVNGRMYEETYEKDGEKRTTVRVDAYAVGPNLSRCTAELQRNSAESVDALLVGIDFGSLASERDEPVLAGVAG
jgi:single-strand DNA-binding protein